MRACSYVSQVAKTTPKTMSIIGGALASLSCVLLGLFYYVDDRLFFPCNVVARLLGGSGMSMLAVSGLSLLFKATNYKAGTILSVVEGTIGGAYILGPATGIVFKQIGGYAGACYIFGIFIGVLVLLQIFMLPNIEDTIKSSKSYFHLVKVPGLVLMFIYCFVNTFGMSSRLVTIPTFIMLTFGVTSSDIGVILCISNTVYMLSSPFIGWMMNQGYIYSIMIGGWISQFFLLLFIGPSPLLDYIFHGQKYFLSCAILWCSLQVSQAVAFLAPFKASLNLAEATGYERNSLHTYGMIAGMINCAQGLGSIVGPVGGGAIYEALGFPWMMTIIGFIQLGVVALMIVFLLGMRATNQPLTSRELTNQSE
ncbi:SLC18B1 [Bugula neritina]|uniref:SLC18B1 n=1 Tax=Bugula neritina TaxID=10212 RepID=A0A7J7K052_BUGNE|nr:SLC18B1 [Bugula neritina]